MWTQGKQPAASAFQGSRQPSVRIEDHNSNELKLGNKHPPSTIVPSVAGVMPRFLAGTGDSASIASVEQSVIDGGGLIDVASETHEHEDQPDRIQYNN